MYTELWKDAYNHVAQDRAEAILAAAHRLLKSEGGESEIVLAASILATVPAQHRQELLEKHVEKDLHAEVSGILNGDPQNRNAAVTHDAILLANYNKRVWSGSLDDLHALLTQFKTVGGKKDANHYLAEREKEQRNADQHAEQHSLSAAQQAQINTGGLPKGKGSGKDREAYHWADQAALRIIASHGNKPHYTVAAGITPSGVVHFGNFREIITQFLVAKGLEHFGKKVRFIYSWDDYDTFRKVPKNLPNQEKFKEYLFQATVDVPDPFACNHESYAAHFKAEILEDLPLVGIFPEFLEQHKKYRACEYAEDIREVLLKREEVRSILNDFKTDDIGPDWWPLNVYCQQCNRDRTVTVTRFDGEYGVSYSCQCGYSTTFDLRKHGISKLPWRVDWPMRWRKEKVDFESAGKDHASAGGSFDSGKVLVEKIFQYPMVEYFMYEFVSPKGLQGKMSSSQGNTITLRQVLQIYTPELVRFMFASTRPSAAFAVGFDVDIFKLYEDFDKVERQYFGAEDAGNEKDRENARRIYELASLAIPPHLPVQPSFRHLTTYVQIAEGDLNKVVSMLAHEIKSPIDEARVRSRAQCAWNWVRTHAPDQYRFALLDKPHAVQMSAELRAALKELGVVLAGQNEEELGELFYAICEKHGVQTMEFFRVAYLTLLAKERGPKLANLITQAGHDRVAAVLKQL